MKRDYRVQPPQATVGENVARVADVVGAHLISLKGMFPVPSDYRGLRHSWVKDLTSGLTVGVVALPLALGFGVASGAGAAAGLITAIIAGLVAAIFGGSNVQVSGPTGAMTVVLMPVIAQYGVETVPLLGIMAGVIVILMGLTAMGRSIEMIPLPVVEGFTFGIGIIIILQQFPLLLGTPKGTAESTLVSSWLTLSHTDWTSAVAPLLVAALVIVLHVVGRRFLPRLPIALVAIVIATLVAELAHLDIARIGTLPGALPTPRVPAVSVDILRQLLPPALAVAALAALESLLSARVADGMVPGARRTNPDRELFGQGLANVAAGIFGGIPATGAIARTAVNVRGGARTRVASIAHAGVLLVVLVALGPIVARIPMAALGAVLVMTAVRMVSPAVFRTLVRATRADRNTFLVTLAATVVLDLVMAVLLGIAMAALMSLRHMAAYAVVRRQYLPADTREGVIDWTDATAHLRDRVAIYRLDGALFYGNARRFADLVLEVEDVDAVIIRCHRMNILDASGADAVKDVVGQLHRRGIPVIIQGMTDAQRRTVTTMNAVSPDAHVLELSEALAAAERICATTPPTATPTTDHPDGEHG
ncbi:SulP family inorganic anion transporter [Raineyella fluvialis]|uniref:SulP family inorganic anion transporter n=1 Tax=Raineyella fluvialis TaxID=2662261 RepID=UPI0018905F48|nr:SulP family inorganic anion transporter [Raineyella fluvialis]